MHPKQIMKSDRTMENLKVSLGIMAYNEEANIGKLLQLLRDERPEKVEFNEIFVVASGCTDRTVSVVQECARRDRRIRLLVQERREGKASAINLFLSQASGDIIVLESADTLLKRGSIEKLSIPFMNPDIGMTGGHPVPIDNDTTFTGFASHLLWRLHHCIALETPKLGEMVAFRNIVQQIPFDSAVDEASIEAIVRKAGLSLLYVPDAIVYNKGPECISDWLRQRRRIAAGHKRLEKEQRYEVSTLSPLHILPALLKMHRWNVKETIWTAGVICMEILARFLGSFDYYIRQKNPYIWDVASSTKSLTNNFTKDVNNLPKH